MSKAIAEAVISAVLVAAAFNILLAAVYEAATPTHIEGRQHG